MRLPATVLCALLLSLLLPAVPARAWGVLGHQVIADLAQDMLTPKARERAGALLGPPSAGGSGGAGYRLGSISVWADDIKSLRPETRSWHYVTIQIDEPRYDSAKAAAPNVVTALKRQLRVLGDTAADRYAREEALKWVVHLVGDLHQPLHVGEDRDRGGNLAKVKVGRRTRNLHEVWDYVLFERLGLPADSLVALLSRSLAAEPGFAAAAARGTVEAWVDETHAKTRACYLLHGKPMRKGIAVSLDRTYLRLATVTALHQLKLAAVRLAQVMNAALDPAAPAAPPAPARARVPAGWREDTAAWFAAAKEDPAVDTAGAEARRDGRGAGKGEGARKGKAGAPAAAGARFYWSGNSKVYHRAGCADIARILPKNLRGGDTPPPGLTLHAGCPRKP